LVRKGIYLPDKKVPLFSKVAQDWLRHKKANVRASTWNMYRGHLEHHFGSVDSIKVNRITPAKVEEFISEKQEDGMNLSTLRKLIVTFNQAMKYAVRHKYIDHNPVTDAERPKGQGVVEDEPMQILTPLEITAFLGAETDPEYRMLFRLAVMSGARQGELFGLKWPDVDWFSGQIHIQRTFNNGAWYKPKSKASNRKVDIGPSTMAELKNWKVACPPNKHDLVFPNKSGNPLDHGYMLRHHFWPALKKAKLPTIRFHDLRHTFASLLIEQGENPKYIQVQLGHSSPTVTLDVYAHLMKPTNQKSAITLENTVYHAKRQR